MDGDRQIGFGGVGPVPFSAIDRLATRYGIDDADAFDRLRAMIEAMDEVYREHLAQKNKQK